MAQEQSSLQVRHRSGHWHTPAIQAYEDEAMLKLLLRDTPQLLPYYSKGSVFVDELTVPLIGSVDLAGVDLNGDITLVECKLGKSPEIRRSIIGQIFAYAAGLWQMSYDDFDQRLSARLKNKRLADAIRQALPTDVTSDWEFDRFRSNVSANLLNGHFKLIIAVDRITEELKLVVPYVNAHTLPGVKFVALELGYVKDDDVEIIRPLTYGQESAAEKQLTTRRIPWSTVDYFDKLREHSAAIQEVVHDLESFSRERGAEFEGGTGINPSLNVRFKFGGVRTTVWASYLQSSGPTFDLNFEYLRPAVVPIAILSHAAHKMRSLDGAAAKYDDALKKELYARPSLTIDPILLQPGAVDVAKQALEEILSASDLQ